MKLGVLTVPLYDLPAPEAFAYLKKIGVETLEIGSGGFPGRGHCDTTALLADKAKAAAYRDMVASTGLSIAALSVHGNPVHPNKQIAEQAHREFLETCELAAYFGVDTVVTFSGCPGDQPNATYSNWVTSAWPDDFKHILKYQWEECLIPYWQKATQQAGELGVKHIALEMHPGFCVYNPSTMLRLREAVGTSPDSALLGANFDPSHLFWQGIHPTEAIKALKGAIYHFHAKDTRLDAANIAVNGVLDPTSLRDLSSRSWAFCTVGYGHDATTWKQILYALRLAGYDGAISIEHEDGLMSTTEGLEKAVSFLKPLLLVEDAPEMWWA